MKKQLSTLIALSALSLAPLMAQAEGAANPLSFNVGVVTDYRYRGISQSSLKPALQGGADYAAASGFYLGTWASTIKWIKDAGTINSVDSGNSNLEWDIYGGYKGEITKGLSYDVGGLAYVYLGNDYSKVPGGANAHTGEVYGALTYGVVTLKYSHAVTNLFGNANSKNSGYVEIAATFDLGDGWTLAPHAGHQTVKNFDAASYSDFSLTATKDFGKGLSASLAVIGTDAKEAVYFRPDGKFTGKTNVVAGVKYTF